MIWFNGQLLPRAQIDATEAGITLGWGVFTTLAIRDGAPVLWPQHAARLERDAAAARIEALWDAEQLRAGLLELLGRLDVRHGLARVTATRRGDGRWNAQTGANWSIMARSAEADEGATMPLTLEVSPFRVAARAPLAGVKTTSYLPYLIAWENARARGFDEALLLTENERICETARGSIFWAKAGALHTSSLGCGCLRGVGREIVMEQFAVRQGEFTLRDLWDADECFVVSGATGARAIGSLFHEGQTRTFDAPGSQTARAISLFDALF